MARKAKPLTGLSVALGGTFPGTTQSTVQNDLTALGATIAKSITTDTSCLIATQAAVDKGSVKVKDAQDLDVPIVSLGWLESCTASMAQEDFDSYLISSGGAASQKASSNNMKGKKRAVSPDASPLPSQTLSKKQKPEPRFGEGSISKSRNMVVPLDEACHLQSYRVYIDDQGVIYDASLNQTNASNNNNKFYRVQLVHDPAQNDYKTWTRWGRVGERGQNSVLGNGSLNDALKNYEKKFKDKSGLAWDDRGADPKHGKYAYVEKNYAPDSDDDEEKGAAEASDGDYRTPPPSKLEAPVQSLMQLVFNQQFMNATMNDLNYDVNKMPLGKLSKATINRGFQALKDLSNLFDTNASSDEIEELSNRYYSLIPHAFGRNRPPVIDNAGALKRELDMLDSLGGLKEAAELMKKDLKAKQSVHPLDRQFQSLNLNEMTPLNERSTEYKELASYLMNTKGATHYLKYQIQDIFRIERQGEVDRFENSEFSEIRSDRRLLWHGSRATNFGGILSQGLRIAPPEAPVSGYMFGKGIYLADMSSKSANYCCSSISDGHALLLLCEAELGDPMYQLTNASYTAGEDARANGCFSTLGQGRTGPKQWKDASCVHPTLAGVKMPDTSVLPGNTNVTNAYLEYNEYITYDVAQVRLRYLFRVKM